MLQDVNVKDGVRVRVETRSTGSVRLSLDHAFVDLQRCEMAPHEAEFLANALMRAADVLKLQAKQCAARWPKGPESFGGA
jgi:hypothetical protein